jgi:hypothetical protein
MTDPMPHVTTRPALPDASATATRATTIGTAISANLRHRRRVVGQPGAHTPTSPHSGHASAELYRRCQSFAGPATPSFWTHASVYVECPIGIDGASDLRESKVVTVVSHVAHARFISPGDAVPRRSLDLVVERFERVVIARRALHPDQ